MPTVAVTSPSLEDLPSEQGNTPQNVPANDSTKPPQNPPKDVRRSLPNICTTIIGLIIAIPGIVWAVKSYNVAVLANQLNQQESCRSHPSNPFLQASSTCREMHAVGDYDHDALSKRGLTSLAGWTDELYSQSLILLSENVRLIAWVTYQSFCLVFIGFFYLSTCWPHKVRLAICASRRDFCITTFLMLIDIAPLGFETILSKTLVLVALQVEDISKDGQSEVPVRWFRIMGFASMAYNMISPSTIRIWPLHYIRLSTI